MSVIERNNVIAGAIRRDALTVKRVAGGAAGNHTLTGIKVTDELVAIFHFDMTDASEALSDLLSEFSISAADTLNNTGGTDTTGGFLVVMYYAKT